MNSAIQTKALTPEEELRELFNLREDLLSDPYPVYRRVREEAPVVRVDTMVCVARYEDIKNVLRDPETFSSRRIQGSRVKARLAELSPDERAKLEELLISESKQIAQLDDPEHARLRRFVNQTFSAARIAEMRGFLERVSNELLDDIEARGGEWVDLIKDYTFKVPFRAICEVLGVPEDQTANMREWGLAITNGIGTGYRNIAEAYEALRHFEVFVSRRIREARQSPLAGNLISDLVYTDEEGEFLSDSDIAAIFTQMLVSGNTMTLIANALQALDEYPDQQRLLRDDPSLIRGAIEEFLRYATSIHAIHRVAAKDTEIAGFPVRRGETIRLLLASGNHDPAKFENADKLIVTRKNARQHLGLGFGIHTCLGQWLARLDAEVAIETLFRRYRAYEVRKPVVMRKNFTMHGPDQFWIRLIK